MKKVIIAVFLFCVSTYIWSQQRTEFLLEKNWKFARIDDSNAVKINYNDAAWQTVTVPHDWAIYGPFSISNDLQNVAITQDNQKQAMEHAGRTGGLPFVGVGWYRNTFTIPEFTKGEKVFVIFDGAMSNAHVYVNGQLAGYWPYGYNSFYFDITDLVKADEKNVVAVRLENFPESSRWYPGAGLYRNVHIVVSELPHIPVWGTQLTTPVITKEYAKVILKTKIEIPKEDDVTKYTLLTNILDASDKVVQSLKTNISHFDDNTFSQEMILLNPELWDVDHPYLYKAVSNLYDGNKLTDTYTTSFGVRSIQVIPNKGFYLNGKLLKFKGVCNHHDLGPLGAAVNDAAIRRQIRILKDMGANAIRTSHNMPAPELVRDCDEMGLLVMAESFDEWKAPKVQNGYHLYFDDWAEKDLVNLIHQYRNNPSIVMWSIGNEVPDQGTKEGIKITRFLQDICHREDPTRPVTMGMDHVDNSLNNSIAAILDVPGFNYHTYKYQEGYARLPQGIIMGSETASTVSSRGIYKFPVERVSMKKYDDHQSSSYDVEHCDWSDLPEDNFIQHDDLPYSIGEFVWTGFDYLGEPTPYYTDWPSHSSLFGIIDLAGIPKDRYYLYRSVWNTNQNTLHILPHWNWKGKEGQTVPVFVYTNYASAELFINGKSQGRKYKDTSYTVFNTGDKTSQKNLERQKRYRLMWMDTKYEPGTVRVVAYDMNGKAVDEKSIHTAGEPYKLVLESDRNSLAADGKDLSFIRVQIVDKDGNLCPDEMRQVNFKVKGAGIYKAAANGNSISLESFQAPYMKLFNGQLTAIVQSSEMPGSIIFEANSKGVKPATITIKTSTK